MSIQNSLNGIIGSFSALGVATKYFNKQNEILANQKESNKLAQESIDTQKQLSAEQKEFNVDTEVGKVADAFKSIREDNTLSDSDKDEAIQAELDARPVFADIIKYGSNQTAMKAIEATENGLSNQINSKAWSKATYKYLQRRKGGTK